MNFFELPSVLSLPGPRCSKAAWIVLSIGYITIKQSDKY